ncbi:uncharacterized protein DFL_008982 [Arthrobotrys flagrans]|uniref:Uncharacterized protein n=1 Tax=Arthrobotrys flagrans TaxID=97331 RepID=A0A436ZQC8_ARTFL|nr:hypothetical protein DFL_008982 [Arthrobotrys flagrans]
MRPKPAYAHSFQFYQRFLYLPHLALYLIHACEGDIATVVTIFLVRWTSKGWGQHTLSPIIDNSVADPCHR